MPTIPDPSDGVNTPPTTGRSTERADTAEAAFWREKEAGNCKSDRGGYYADGWRDGYMKASEHGSSEGWASYAAEQERHAETVARAERAEAAVLAALALADRADARADADRRLVTTSSLRAALLTSRHLPEPCIAPPGDPCTETGCWDADRCVVTPPAPFWCYPCSRGEHSACSGVAWQPDVPCECRHSDMSTPSGRATEEAAGMSERRSEAAQVRCAGTGSPVANVRRARVGRRLPMTGECPECRGQVEITRKWTAKSHCTTTTPAQPDGEASA